MGSKSLLKCFFKQMTVTNHFFYLNTLHCLCCSFFPPCSCMESVCFHVFLSSAASCSVLWLLRKALVKHLDLPGESFCVIDGKPQLVLHIAQKNLESWITAGLLLIVTLLDFCANCFKSPLSLFLNYLHYMLAQIHVIELKSMACYKTQYQAFFFMIFSHAGDNR